MNKVLENCKVAVPKACSNYSFKDFQKHAPKVLNEMRKRDPETFQALYAQEFGKKPVSHIVNPGINNQNGKRAQEETLFKKLQRDNPEELAKIRNEKPEFYASLYEKQYGKKPNSVKVSDKRKQQNISNDSVRNSNALSDKLPKVNERLILKDVNKSDLLKRSDDDLENGLFFELYVAEENKSKTENEMILKRIEGAELLNMTDDDFETKVIVEAFKETDLD